MDIEFFSDSSVLLIHGHEPTVVSHFRKQVEALALDRFQSFSVHDLPGFRSIGNCKLVAMRANADYGISCPLDANAFECKLLPSTWANIQWLLEPFSNGSYFGASHQYLDQSGTIQFIISGSRGW